MSDKEFAWWEGNSALFAGALPPEMCQAWSQVWSSAKGFTNAEMVAAVKELATIYPNDRPKFPLELINWIENTMRRNALQIAINGHLPNDRIQKLLPDWEKDLEAAREKVNKLGVPYETPESNAYRDMRLNVAKLRNRAHDQQLSQKGDQSCRNLLPQMRTV